MQRRAHRPSPMAASSPTNATKRSVAKATRSPATNEDQPTLSKALMQDFMSSDEDDDGGEDNAAPNEPNAMDNRKQEALLRLQEQQQRLEMSWSSRLRPRRRVERRIVFGNDTAPAPARRRSADKKSPTSSSDMGATTSLRSRRGKGLSPITTTQLDTARDPFPACCSPVLRTASPCRVPRPSDQACNVEDSPAVSPPADAVWPTWTSPAMLRLSDALNTSMFMHTPTPIAPRKGSFTPSATPCKHC